jgi:hypothetical protein
VRAGGAPVMRCAVAGAPGGNAVPDAAAGATVSGARAAMAGDAVGVVDVREASSGPAGAEPITALSGPAGAEPITALSGPAGAEPIIALSGPAGAEPIIALSGPAGVEPITALSGPAGAEPTTRTVKLRAWRPAAAASAKRGSRADGMAGAGCIT